MRRHEFYAGGVWRASKGADVIDVTNPATEEVVGVIPAGDPSDVDIAAQAAAAAVRGWAHTPASERADQLDALAARLDAAAGELAELITTEVGTPALMSPYLQAAPIALLVRAAAQIARDFVWEVERNGSILCHEPIGVVAAIVPWNYPLTLTGYKVPYALAAGCPVVLKPSELAPFSAFRLAEIVDEVGLPPGVFNMVAGGPHVGQALVEHPLVDMVSFTGSTLTGGRVMAAAASGIKRVHLELGGKSAAVMLDDADVASAVSAQLTQCFMNSGQTCLAWSRLLVPRGAQDEVVSALIDQVSTVYRPGPPETALIGPMISAPQRDRVVGFIERGVEAGARLVAGGPGAPPDLDRGYYVEPTLFADVDNSMEIAQEEIFGPVLCVIPYESVEQAIELANDSPYGLHGAVFGRDVARATGVARRLRTGQVDINGFNPNVAAPFGGVKRSGIGKELGVEGFEAFLETKAIQGASA